MPTQEHYRMFIFVLCALSTTKHYMVHLHHIGRTANLTSTFRPFQYCLYCFFIHAFVLAPPDFLICSGTGNLARPTTKHTIGCRFMFFTIVMLDYPVFTPAVTLWAFNLNHRNSPPICSPLLFVPFDWHLPLAFYHPLKHVTMIGCTTLNCLLFC